MRGELVVVGQGKKAHRKWDDFFTYCGLGGADNSKPTTGLHLCLQCEKLLTQEIVRHCAKELEK